VATNPMPSPDPQGGSPQGGPPSPPPQGGPQGGPPPQGGPQQGEGDQATQLQQLFAQWYQVSKQIAASDPRLSSGMEKVAQGIQEAQAALVTPPQPTPTAQQPSYA
jgi:hypothetical protein